MPIPSIIPVSALGRKSPKRRRANSEQIQNAAANSEQSTAAKCEQGAVAHTLTPSQVSFTQLKRRLAGIREKRRKKGVERTLDGTEGRKRKREWE